ncbi:hypothetical protein GJ496_011741 [Pomphorhynchus laevis]|nr:hypothetical protein GJ496_011741 [Pomphorhynchus laevis]
MSFSTLTNLDNAAVLSGESNFSSRIGDENNFISLYSQVPRIVTTPTCLTCKNPITDKYYFRVSHRSFHENCLRCMYCNVNLSGERTCFTKGSQIMCRQDCKRYYSLRCVSCSKLIDSDDWIRKTYDRIYHISCFACYLCKKQFQTGDQFVLLSDKVLCRKHFSDSHSKNKKGDDDFDNRKLSSQSKVQKLNFDFNQCVETLNSNTNQLIKLEESTLFSQSSSASSNNVSTTTSRSSSNQLVHTMENSSRSKRVRTNFNDDQIRILQSSFDNDPNPDANELERIAMSTGLSKRVTQVWFQNSRARQKKYRDNAQEHYQSSEQTMPNGTNISTTTQSFNLDANIFSNSVIGYNDDRMSPLSYVNESSVDASSCDENF